MTIMEAINARHSVRRYLDKPLTEDIVKKFTFYYRDGKVEAKAGLGFYANIDIEIVKYHFEIGAGKENFEWG